MKDSWLSLSVCIFLLYSLLLSRFLLKYDASMCDAGQGYFFKQVNLNILFVDKLKLQMDPFKKHCKQFSPKQIWLLIIKQFIASINAAVDIKSALNHRKGGSTEKQKQRRKEKMGGKRRWFLRCATKWK